MREGQLLAMPVDKEPFWIENSYDSIKGAMLGATIDFKQGPGMGFFIDDNGMVDERALNVPVSIMMQQPIYGHAVLTHQDPDDEGETLPPEPRIANACRELAVIWNRIRVRARGLGQSLDVFADSNFMPMPTFIELPENWNFGDPLPLPEECPECGSTDRAVKLPPCSVDGDNDWHRV